LIAYYGAACALGAAAGVGFAWLWLRLVPPGTNRRFWSSMSELARGMLAVEETREFFALYRRLGGLLARYVGRNLGATVVACLPMIAILLAADAIPAARAYAERAAPGDINPLSPLLSDIEAAFFAVFMLATVIGLLWPHKPRS
jgi:hypothetical protein